MVRYPHLQMDLYGFTTVYHIIQNDKKDPSHRSRDILMKRFLTLFRVVVHGFNEGKLDEMHHQRHFFRMTFSEMFKKTQLHDIDAWKKSRCRSSGSLLPPGIKNCRALNALGPSATRRAPLARVGGCEITLPFVSKCCEQTINGDLKWSNRTTQLIDKGTFHLRRAKLQAEEAQFSPILSCFSLVWMFTWYMSIWLILVNFCEYVFFFFSGYIVSI